MLIIISADPTHSKLGNLSIVKALQRSPTKSWRAFQNSMCNHHLVPDEGLDSSYSPVYDRILMKEIMISFHGSDLPSSLWILELPKSTEWCFGPITAEIKAVLK